jgi:replicative superfamily II helicase
MDFLKRFAENLDSKSYSNSTGKNFERQRISPQDVETFIKHIKLVIPFFCEHPHSILEKIEKLREDGLESIVKYLHQATKNNTQVWNGTIGEAIATAYILSSTDYKIPVFKLRFAPNRKMAMHGDDILGFKVDTDGNPQELLVVEVKNYGANPKQAVEKASDGLLKVQQSSITLLDFIIITLKEKNRINEAKLVKRFSEPYNYSYHTEYLAFIITQESKWKDKYFDTVVDEIKPPLTINAFLIPNWIEYQKQLVLPEENKIPTKITLPEVEINDLEDLRKLLDNGTFKNEHNQLASEALTIDLKNQQRKSTAYTYNPIKLEKSANFLVSTGYNLLDDSSEEAEKVLKEAAVIYERLAIVRLEDGQKFAAVDNVITSALLYSLAGYNANAKVLVSKILCHQDIQDSLSSDTPRILLAYLLNGEIIKIQNRLAEFFYQFPQNKLEEVEEFPKEEEEWMYWVSEKISSIGDYLTAKIFAYFIHYLRTGNELYKSEIIKLTIAAGKQYATIGNYRSYVLLSSIRRYLENLIENSTQNLVRSNLVDIQEEWKLYLRFLSTLGKFPMMSMWKSQQKALQEGLLEDKSLIIAMPTSAGKTKTVEIAIYKALKNNPDKICAYVVPTRALAYEVESSLSVSLSRVNVNVSILYGGYDFSQLEEDVLQDNQVFVLTPEKLDLLTRSNDKFKNKLALLIIDEVHDSAAANPRSMRQELTYSRLLAIAERNKIRVIGISAVVNNAEDFAKWLCNDENNVIEIDWRPTKQRLGYLKWGLGRDPRSTVQYLSQTDDYPTDNFFIPLPFFQSQCKKKSPKGGSYIDSNFVAARLSIYYSKTGSTLVFTTTKPLVESIAKCLIQIRENDEHLVISLQMQNIANELAEILGNNHLLVKSINHGFCYHHAELPSTVRRKVENAVRANIIPLIISTTTLSQGVNLPIKNVIVHSLSMHGIISMTQYKNAVGRAGRAGAETEGHIIFCDEKDLKRVQQEETTEKSESFLMSGIKNLVKLRLLSVESTEDFLSLWAISSTSQFRKNGSNYENWKKRMQTEARKSQSEILSYLDSQILAWILETCIDEVDEDKIEVIFKRLLCNVQSLELQSILAEFKEALKVRAILLKERLPDIQKRQLFNITGLGVDSNQLITEYAHKLVKEIENFNNLSDLPQEFWQETYNIFKEITELKQDLHLDNGIDPLIGWLDGKDYKELADLYFDGNSEIVVRKLEKVIYAFAWGFNSLISHINFYLNLNGKKIPNIFKSLTSFITHGVSNTAAVYAISLGVYDRQIAIALSTTYQLAFPQIEYTHFKRWLFTLSFEQWKDIAHVEDENISKIEEHFKNVQTKQQKLEKNTNIFDCSLIKINDFIITNENVEKDDLIIVSFDENLYLTTYEYKLYYQLAGEKIERLKQFDRQVYDFIINDIDPQRETVSILVY